MRLSLEDKALWLATSNGRLKAENADLREKLAQAEATIRRMQSSAGKALAARRPRGDGNMAVLRRELGLPAL